MHHVRVNVQGQWSYIYSHFTASLLLDLHILAIFINSCEKFGIFSLYMSLDWSSGFSALRDKYEILVSDQTVFLISIIPLGTLFDPSYVANLRNTEGITYQYRSRAMVIIQKEPEEEDRMGAYS